MTNLLQNDLFWLLILVTTVFICVFVYMFIKNLYDKIENLNRRYKMLAAISFEHQLHCNPVPPKKISLLRAGITIDDLEYFGYTQTEIQAVFPEYHS